LIRGSNAVKIDQIKIKINKNAGGYLFASIVGHGSELAAAVPIMTRDLPPEDCCLFVIIQQLAIVSQIGASTMGSQGQKWSGKIGQGLK
jgi:hypothetical protein